LNIGSHLAVALNFGHQRSAFHGVATDRVDANRHFARIGEQESAQLHSRVHFNANVALNVETGVHGYAPPAPGSSALRQSGVRAENHAQRFKRTLPPSACGATRYRLFTNPVLPNAIGMGPTRPKISIWWN